VIQIDVPIQGGFGISRPIKGGVLYNVTGFSGGRDNSTTDLYADIDAMRSFDFNLGTPLLQGWNLISLPWASGNSLTELLNHPGLPLDRAWTYVNPGAAGSHQPCHDPQWLYHAQPARPPGPGA